MDREKIIGLENISKNFGHIQALKNINIDIYKGEIISIVGDNGSGKSTLIKILSGLHEPDSGNILIGNRKYKKLSPRISIKEGISTVYQDLALDNYKNSVENIFLGNEMVKYAIFLDKKSMNIEARRLLDSLNINIKDIQVPVGYLSGGQRQSIAIARAIHQNNDVIIFDEPTAAMGIKETSATMELIKKLNKYGKTIVIISHNINSVYDVSDRVYIMRNGNVISEIKPSESSINDIISLIMKNEIGESAGDLSEKRYMDES